jgi:hypothetical protein
LCDITSHHRLLGGPSQEDPYFTCQETERKKKRKKKEELFRSLRVVGHRQPLYKGNIQHTHAMLATASMQVNLVKKSGGMSEKISRIHAVVSI